MKTLRYEMAAKNEFDEVVSRASTWERQDHSWSWKVEVKNPAVTPRNKTPEFSQVIRGHSMTLMSAMEIAGENMSDVAEAEARNSDPEYWGVDIDERHDVMDPPRAVVWPAGVALDDKPFVLESKGVK